MEYQEIKSLIGKIFMVNADDHNSITGLIKFAEDRAAGAEWGRNKSNPDKEFRQIMVTAARLLADYADNKK